MKANEIAKSDKRVYPQNKHEWGIVIQQGLGVTLGKGKRLNKDGKFPVQDLAQFIKKEYSEGYGPNFVPALLRNLKGLINWVYGDGSEPYWPGSDT